MSRQPGKLSHLNLTWIRNSLWIDVLPVEDLKTTGMM